MSRSILIGVSLGAHALLALALGEIRVEKASASTPIEIAEVQAPPPAAPPEPVKVEQPAAEPVREKRRPAPRRELAPEPVRQTAAPVPAFDDVPDFGLALEGGVSTGGLAVPSRGAEPRSTPRAVKRLAEPVAPVTSGCSEPASKPKPLSVPQPVYTEAARAANVAGRVRVELTVDEQGRVIDVKVLQGLGYGLDEAAVSAARSGSFTPAERCGRAVRATFTIAMRFSAG
jgi:periplasmic protein TonB